MVRLDSQNKKIPELVQNILLEKTLSYWDESHGSGNLALALREYRNTYEVGQSDTSASVFFGERNLIDQSFSGSASSILQEEYSLDRLFEKNLRPLQSYLFKEPVAKVDCTTRPASIIFPQKMKEKQSQTESMLRKKSIVWKGVIRTEIRS